MPSQIDFDPTVDYYAAIGVTSHASLDDIKKAYRRLARQYHPDSTGGDKVKEARFKDVQAAYDVLSDAKRRALYDDLRGSGGGTSTRGVYQHQDSQGIRDFGEILNQFFNEATRQGVIPRGAIPRVRIPRVRVDRVEYEPPEASETDHETEIQASDGTWLRVLGSDVHSDVRITFDQAITGTVATVATVNGQSEVKIPSGTSSGKKLRLRGKGTVDRSGRPGDHYVTVQIDVPHPDDLDVEALRIVGQIGQRLRRRR